MKERINASVDSEVLEEARKYIPNISSFVEDCFRAYLKYSTEDEEERGKELQQEWINFNKAKLNIHLLMNVDYEGNSMQKALEKKKKDAWLNVWSEYRRSDSIQEYTLKESAKTLEIETEVLRELLLDVKVRAKNDTDNTATYYDWKYIEEEFLPNVIIDDELEAELDELLKR